jgi:hypothetical protein
VRLKAATFGQDLAPAAHAGPPSSAAAAAAAAPDATTSVDGALNGAIWGQKGRQDGL